MTQPTTIAGRPTPSPEFCAPWRKEARATATLAWPLVMTFLSETAIEMIDVVVIGRLGAGALASAALGVMSFFLFILLVVGITLSTASLAAQAMGARNPRQVRRVIRQGLWISALLGFPLAFVLLYAEPALVAMGQPPEAARGAQEYLNYLTWALPTGAAFMVLRNFAAVLNRPRLGLWVLLGAIPLNTFLDIGLVLGHFGMPRMGIAGAGLASLIAHALMFVVMLWMVTTVKPLARYNILGRFWRPDWTVFWRIFRVGGPIAGLMLVEFGLIGGALIMMGWVGANALAAHQIAIMLASVTFKVPLGIAQAATVRVGHAAGRRDLAGVARAGWMAMAMGVLFMGTMSVIMWIWPDALARIFLDASDPANAEVLVLAATLILIAAFFQVGDGAQTIGAGVLRGLNDTAVPMTFAMFGFWGLGLSAGYGLAFPAEMGAAGVWIGITIGLSFVALFHVLRFRHLTRIGYLPRVLHE